MAKNNRIVFKYPGNMTVAGYKEKFSYVIVPGAEAEKLIKDGWSLTPVEAKDKFEKNIKTSKPAITNSNKAESK